MLLEGLLLLILLKTFESSRFPSVFEILVNDISMTPDDDDDEVGDDEVGDDGGEADIGAAGSESPGRRWWCTETGVFQLSFGNTSLTSM